MLLLNYSRIREFLHDTTLVYSTIQLDLCFIISYPCVKYESKLFYLDIGQRTIFG